MIDRGDTAWILTASALVLFMTIPGLSLFYGGLVRAKNVLSVLMQCFALTALVTLLWLAYGYSLAFDTSGMRRASQPALVHRHAREGVPARRRRRLPDGHDPRAALLRLPAHVRDHHAGADRRRLRRAHEVLGDAVFMTGWLTFVYLPVCHMIWGGPGGFFFDLGVLDFAGGIVVHITAGIAALVVAIVLGRRRGWPRTPMPPHNLTLTVDGHRHALGGLVRLQRRQRARRERQRRDGAGRHAGLGRDRRADLDGDRVGELRAPSVLGIVTGASRGWRRSRPRRASSGRSARS